MGLTKADDAAVYQMNDQQAIITTTDFFPPIVDDPYDFGAIAAANALSDVYAMGGKVLFAMNIVAFPDGLNMDILREILRGGADKVKEAGAVIVGGHSVADKEPKYGLSVTGVIDPKLVKKKGGAQAGDILVLTKPLGVGIVTTALKQGKTTEEEVAVAVASMKQLNKAAAEAAIAASAHGMTDITGFGLLGHAHEMADQANVDFHFSVEQLPWSLGAMRHGSAEIFPGGTWRNYHHFTPLVTFADSVEKTIQNMLWTPETSGGLLVSLAPENVDLFMRHCPAGNVVGKVTAGSGRIHVA